MTTLTPTVRAVLDAAIAVAMTIAIMAVLYLFTSALTTVPLVGGRAWWVVAWAVLVIATSALLSRRSTSVRHLACLGVSIALVLLHLLAYWAGLVMSDAPTPALLLTDFVFLGAAIASLTLVNIRRRDFREIDRG